MRATSDLTTGFEIIRRYDPALYAKMLRSDWQVSTSMNVMSLMTPNSVWLASQAYGTTETNLSWRSGIPGLPPESYINMRPITRQAHEWGIPPEYFLAAVLAHEFRHTTQDGNEGAATEAPAFAAGSEFAAKLPVAYGGPIIELSDNTIAEWERGEKAW